MPSAETIAALAFFGLVCVLPIVSMLLRHQRAMAELLHRNSDAPDSNARIDALEREVHYLRDQLNQRLISDDERKQLGERLKQQ